eukprot:Gb_01540 [translate_table: standard]
MGASSLMGMLHKIKNGRCNGLHNRWWLFSQQILYLVWRPAELAVAAAGNLGRPVDGVNTIGMLLTSVKVYTKARYPSVSTKDEGGSKATLPFNDFLHLHICM